MKVMGNYHTSIVKCKCLAQFKVLNQVTQKSRFEFLAQVTIVTHA